MKQSDIIWGMGMPVHQHVNWMIIWKFHSPETAKELEYGQYGDDQIIKQLF